MNFRSFFTAAAIAAATLVPASSLAAAPSNTAEQLANSVLEAGVDVYVNCPDDASYMGLYSGSERAFVVCAEGRMPAQFTEEEQDTLRHEAIHLAQDCMDGRLGYGMETTAYISQVMKMVEASGLNAHEIERLYRSMGADDEMILLELEAWSGAALYSNVEINDLVRRACRLPV